MSLFHLLHQHQISLTSPTGDTIPKNVYTRRKNLGHYKAPDGNYVSQKEEILKKPAMVTDDIITSGASRTEATLLYETVYCPTVEYTLPQSFLTPSQLHQIKQKTLPRLYARCGYNRNTSRDVLHGPRDVGGGGFTTLQTVAGAGYIAHFLKYFCSPHEDAGKLMCVVLAWTQFQTGFPFPILSQPSTDKSKSTAGTSTLSCIT